MSFDWLSAFQQQREKPDDYAERSLAAYQRGMKSGGSIIGVRVVVTESCCQAARQIPADTIYHPDEAPRLPLTDCPLGNRCQCVYRPVMSYEKKEA